MSRCFHNDKLDLMKREGKHKKGRLRRNNGARIKRIGISRCPRGNCGNKPERPSALSKRKRTRSSTNVASGGTDVDARAPCLSTLPPTHRLLVIPPLPHPFLISALMLMNQPTFITHTLACAVQIPVSTQIQHFSTIRGYTCSIIFFIS